MVVGSLLGGLGIGAGVGASSVALAPFNAANTFLGSAFFGYGMILGERYMYQEDWPKIQARLVNGEKIENIIQEYTGVFTAVVMKEAKIVFDTVTREFIEIMRQALHDSFPHPTDKGGPGDCPPGFYWDGKRCRPSTKPPPPDEHVNLSPVQKQIHQAHGHPQGVKPPKPSPKKERRETKLIKKFGFSYTTNYGVRTKSVAINKGKRWFMLSHPHGDPKITLFKITLGPRKSTNKYYYEATVAFTHIIGKL